METRGGKKARALIDEWKPDPVYANDDNARKYVIAAYPEGKTHFVFSGVNASPSDYGFDQRNDISGVLEQEHSLQTIKHLKKIQPDMKKIAVFIDDGPTWPAVIERTRQALADSDLGVEVVAWERISHYADYQKKLLGIQDQVDAVGILGIFSLRDQAGNNVPYQEVLRWSAQNSNQQPRRKKPWSEAQKSTEGVPIPKPWA